MSIPGQPELPGDQERSSHWAAVFQSPFEETLRHNNKPYQAAHLSLTLLPECCLFIKEEKANGSNKVHTLSEKREMVIVHGASGSDLAVSNVLVVVAVCEQHILQLLRL